MTDLMREFYSPLAIACPPFWGWQWSIERLLANFLVLRAGLLPIVNPNEERKTYTTLLGEY